MIGEFKGEYEFLSNFFPVEVELDGMKYPSVECAYQAAKNPDPEYRSKCAAATSAQSKKLGKRVVLRPDWEKVKIDVMTRLLVQKFKQPKFESLLLATGDEELVEGNWWGDRFWGVCEGKGENHLGRLLMAIRDELRK